MNRYRIAQRAVADSRRRQLAMLVETMGQLQSTPARSLEQARLKEIAIAQVVREMERA